MKTGLRRSLHFFADRQILNISRARFTRVESLVCLLRATARKRSVRLQRHSATSWVTRSLTHPSTVSVVPEPTAVTRFNQR